MNTSPSYEQLIWPTEGDLNNFEHTLPRPTDEQLLGSVASGSAVRGAAENQQTQWESDNAEHEQKIEHYLNTAYTASHIWTLDIKPEHGRRMAHGFTLLYDPKLRPVMEADAHTRDEMLKETKQYPTLQALTKAGINETCTFQRIDKGLENPVYPGEQLIGLTYGASSYDYPDGTGRPGNVMWVKFILPDSVARALYKDVREDPRILRDMTERYIKEQVLSEKGKAEGGDWDRYIRPPYEKWDERPTNVMAFRKSYDQVPEDIPDKMLMPIPPRQ